MTHPVIADAGVLNMTKGTDCINGSDVEKRMSPTERIVKRKTLLPKTRKERASMTGTFHGTEPTRGTWQQAGERVIEAL